MQTYNKNQVFFAGFWVRVAAYVIDSTICGGLFLAAHLGIPAVAFWQTGGKMTGNIIFHYSLIDIVFYMGSVLYYILCTYYTGATLGKKLMNLKVISTSGGSKLPIMDVIYRETVGRFLSGCIMSAGYLMIASDKEKRGLHDVLSDTRVVYVKKICGLALKQH